MTIMEELIPPQLDDCVVQLERVDDYTEHLFPEELEVVKDAGPARKFEYSTGRHIARRLLSEMGFEPGPILRDESGRPLWSAEVKGSITHKGKICMVALSRSDRYQSLGTDIEEVEPLEQDVWKVFTTEAELTGLTEQGISEAEAINIVFSVKETLYKCAYPMFDVGTTTFVDEKISYRRVDTDLLEAICSYNSLFFRVIVRFGPKLIISVGYV